MIYIDNNRHDVNSRQIDDIVTMIDQFMSENGGHMNISVSSNKEINSNKNVQTSNSLECSLTDMSCNIPTLHEGLDADE